MGTCCINEQKLYTNVCIDEELNDKSLSKMDDVYVDEDANDKSPRLKIQIDKVYDDLLQVKSDWERQKCIMAAMHPHILSNYKQRKIATKETVIIRRPTKMYLMDPEDNSMQDLANRLIAEEQKRLDSQQKHIVMHNKHHGFVEKYKQEVANTETGKNNEQNIGGLKPYAYSVYDEETSDKVLHKSAVNESKDTFSIHKTHRNKIAKKCTPNTCAYTSRIITAMLFYQTLDINNNDDRIKLVEFCHQEHTLLNDYIHILTVHNDEDHLQQIFDLLLYEKALGECNIMNCAVSLRHYRDRRAVALESKPRSEDPEILFYQDMMDQIHCWLYHLYDTAFRIKKDDIKQNDLEDSNDKLQYIDTTFSNICNIINTKKKALRDEIGIDSYRFNSSKFHVVVTEKQKGTLFENLKTITKRNAQIKHTSKQSLWNMLEQEEYDSDAIEADINWLDDEHKNSNISQYDTAAYDVFKSYIHYHQLNQHTFNIGYRFYYWKFYMQQTKVSDSVWYDNVNDHGGYNTTELCINQKYNNLKDEILNNQILTLNMSQLEISIRKTRKYADSERAKSITATPDYGDQLFEHDRNDELHYGIKAGTPITFHHLLSIILYCDWSDLCTKLSSSFRNLESFHTLSDVKQNNEEYANWSRLLREVVEQFGYNHAGEYNKNYTSNEDKIINRLKGPFFCGMSFVMMIPEFGIRLCGPTSTSKHIEVATRFGGEQGIIMQLTNSKDVNVFSDNVCAFPCAWLSNYSGEEEYLFCGGKHRIRIENIRRIDTKQIFEEHFSALYHFECLVNGREINDDVSNKYLEYECIEALIKHKLKQNGFQNTYPDYINSTFDAFLHHKTQIVVNVPFLQHTDLLLPDLIFSSPPVQATYNVNMDQDWCFDDTIAATKMVQHTTIFAPILYKLFANVNHIIIYSTSIWGNDEYEFDLSYFAASVYKMTNKNIKIEVKAVDRYDYATWKKKQPTHSWLRSAIETIDPSFNAQITRAMNGIGRGEDTVRIYAFDDLTK